MAVSREKKHFYHRTVPTLGLLFLWNAKTPSDKKLTIAHISGFRRLARVKNFFKPQKLHGALCNTTF